MEKFLNKNFTEIVNVKQCLYLVFFFLFREFQPKRNKNPGTGVNNQAPQTQRTEVSLKLDIQGQEGGIILDIYGESGLENWKTFM